MHKPVNFASLTDSLILLLFKIIETLILNVNAANKKQLSGLKKLPALSRNRPNPRSEKGCEKWHFWSKISQYGKDLENRAVHPHQEFLGVPPGPRELGAVFSGYFYCCEYLTKETTSTLDIQCKTFIAMLQSVI